MNMLTSDTLCPLLHSKAAPGKGEGEGGIEGTPADATVPGGSNLPLPSAWRIKPRSALGARRISS